ncbi:DNA repair protein RecN [Hazenella sp. IB182353]|uniref:DNA repair protein RecN n=1 Tax=Polycladospora coralii TaxID=2771432 RepID=UPI0017464A81|nr:DNA repair protein RecN [Polycladospora coralii]MBS7530919.1 DNA repair protein RecN [Polycladospora coralii]
MLREIAIRNFAIIDEVCLQFQHGFHVFTGETGAGKSILIDALSLIAGGRASSEMVQYGADKAVVEAWFEVTTQHPIYALLNEWELNDQEDTVIIQRTIMANGKSSCRVNGRTVTVSMLKQMSSKLIDISGQHEHQSLLSVEEQLEWLDQYGGEALLSIKSAYQKFYRAYQEQKQKIEQLQLNQNEIEQRIELLQFQVEEIAVASLTPGEDLELEREEKRLSAAEKLMKHAEAAYENLYGDFAGLERIQSAVSELEHISEYDEALHPIIEEMQSGYYQLEEATRQLSKYREMIEYDPNRLQEVTERLHMIKQLKRKYGTEIEEILNYEVKIISELQTLENREDQLEEMTQKLEVQVDQLMDLASKLTALRKNAASSLEVKVESELHDLNMKSTVFHVAFLQTENRKQLLPTGWDQIVFQISPNPGEPLKSLSKIASGGELSRILLALKVIFADLEQIHTLVFDEIDTGVSGRAAQAIAEKISRLGWNNQVLAVSHLPQVASMADHHFFISKTTSQDKTRTTVTALTEQRERTRAVARMLGGVEITETTLNHAKEMIAMASDMKIKKM